MIEHRPGDSPPQETEATQPAATPAKRRRKLIRFFVVLLLAMLLNLAVILLGSMVDIEELGVYGYLGIFVIALLGNATVLFPVPYPAVVALAASKLNLLGVAVSSAAGSVIGESLAFIVGRNGQAIVERTRLYEWTSRQLRHPVRAAVVIFILAAVPNPVFDVAGLAAGAMGLSYRLFLIPTFLGRIIKMLIFGIAGQQFLGTD